MDKLKLASEVLEQPGGPLTKKQFAKIIKDLVVFERKRAERDSGMRLCQHCGQPIEPMTKRGPSSDYEIEITPEMIEAGLDCLSDLPELCWASETLGAALARAFRAMLLTKREQAGVAVILRPGFKYVPPTQEG